LKRSACPNIALSDIPEVSGFQDGIMRPFGLANNTDKGILPRGSVEVDAFGLH
jgi:hypothetical protein